MIKNPMQCGRPEFNPCVGKIPWRRVWQPTPVFLTGEFHGQRSLTGYNPWCRKDSDTTEWLSLSLFQLNRIRRPEGELSHLSWEQSSREDSDFSLSSLLNDLKETLPQVGDKSLSVQTDGGATLSLLNPMTIKQPLHWNTKAILK